MRMDAYRQAGVTSNWDEEMRASLLEELGKAGIDVDALDDRALVERASAWLLSHATYDSSQFTGYFTHFPKGRPAVFPGCEPGMEQYNRGGRSVEAQWAHDLLAKDMYVNGTRGSCTSTAIYLNAGLRALGVPTRIVYCIPVIDPSDPNEVRMLAGLRHPRVRPVLVQALGKLGDSWSGHTFNEVYVGGRWRRLNYANLGQNTFGAGVFGLLTHVFTVNDWAEADVAPTIGVRQAKGRTEDVFGHRNPYSTVELSDRFGVHASIDAEPEGPDEWRALTIERAIWYDSPERPPSITTKIGDPRRAGYVLLRVRENHADAGLAQYRRFWEAVDKAFVLRAEGHDDLTAEATRGYWGSGWFFLEVPRAEFDRMAFDVPYELVPEKGEGEMRWAMAEDVRLTRTAEPPRAESATVGTVRTLDRLAWSDAPAGRQVLGEYTGMPLSVLAHVEAYDGDFDALKRLQAGIEAPFLLEAEGHPTLRAGMGTGGITNGRGEAWVILRIEGEPSAGVTYRLRSPDARWVVRGDLPAR